MDAATKKPMGEPCIGLKSNLPTMGWNQIFTTGLIYGDLNIQFLLDCAQEERVLNELTDIAIIDSNTRT
jgi:hypothetical protein